MTSIREARRFGLLAAALIVSSVVPMAAQEAAVTVPKVTGPIAVTADSQPFSGEARLISPIDLKKAGYVEEEFILNGAANVYDWAPDGTLSVKTEKAPYGTRILVRRPANASKFSGNVVVEPSFPPRRYDWSLMWGYVAHSLIEHGDAWVGVTLPATSGGLKKFNPTRYAEVSFANPNPGAACPGAGKNGPSDVEDGLRFDMLSQVGAALKGAPATMGGFKVEGIFMTTQGGGDLVTYMNAIHSHAKLANGKPVYDGYLSRNPGNVGRLNQCATPPPTGDPRNGFKKLGVPIIAVVAQGEVIATRGLRRADSDDPADRFRMYEIAGVGHIDKAAYSQFPLVADQIAAVGATQGTPDWPLNVTCDPPIPLTEQPVLGYIYDAAFQNLFQWVRKGTSPPKGDRIQIKEDVGEFVTTRTVALDEYGNGLGGVRTPYVDVPVATYFTVSPGPGTCGELGHKVGFEPARLGTLYPNVKAYTTKVGQSVDRMVKDRWLTESDGKKIKAELNSLPSAK